MRQRQKLGITCVLAAIVVIGVCGCSQPPEAPPPPGHNIPREMFFRDWPVQEVPVAHIVRRDYRIREGDQLEVIYHVRHQRNLEYRIKIQDVIEVRFPFKATLNQIEQVQSDGYLYLDLIQPIYVFDRTIKDVREELVKRYSAFVKDPTITVSFKQSNVKIAELKQAITTSPRGQSRLVPVTPDGTISLPFVVSIRTAGKTIEELHKALNFAYASIGLDELEVTVNLQTVAPTLVYVLGEVRIPGALLNRTGAITGHHEMTLLQALAKAGSYLPKRAELSKVMLIRRRHLPRPQATIVNVFQLLENRNKMADGHIAADMANHRYDIWLEDGDIVFVPTTKIAKRADYIEYVWARSIRAVGGFTSHYSIADDVDWLGPNP